MKGRTGCPKENSHARMIHDRFCCTREFAATTSLAVIQKQPGGRARRSVRQHTVSSMSPSLAAPRGVPVALLYAMGPTGGDFAVLQRTVMNHVGKNCEGGRLLSGSWIVKRRTLHRVKSLTHPRETCRTSPTKPGRTFRTGLVLLPR